MPGSLAARLLLGREKPWVRVCIRVRKVWKVVHWRFISTGLLLGENKDLLSARSMHKWKFMNSGSWSENTIPANRRKRSLYLFGVLNQLTQSWWVISLVETWCCEKLKKNFLTRSVYWFHEDWGCRVEILSCLIDNAVSLVKWNAAKCCVVSGGIQKVEMARVNGSMSRELSFFLIIEKQYHRL